MRSLANLQVHFLFKTLASLAGFLFQCLLTATGAVHRWADSVKQEEEDQLDKSWRQWGYDHSVWQDESDQSWWQDESDQAWQDDQSWCSWSESWKCKQEDDTGTSVSKQSSSSHRDWSLC